MGRFAKLEQYTANENDFWQRFVGYAGHIFTTMRGLEFTFEVRGNEVFFDRKAKSVTRSTIIRGYRKALELKQSGDQITSPKQLGVFGASYILPVLMSEGIIDLTSSPEAHDDCTATPLHIAPQQLELF